MGGNPLALERTPGCLKGGKNKKGVSSATEILPEPKFGVE
jgi:hypothetical protein